MTGSSRLEKNVRTACQGLEEADAAEAFKWALRTRSECRPATLKAKVRSAKPQLQKNHSAREILFEQTVWKRIQEGGLSDSHVDELVILLKKVEAVKDSPVQLKEQLRAYSQAASGASEGLNEEDNPAQQMDPYTSSLTSLDSSQPSVHGMSTSSLTPLSSSQPSQPSQDVGAAPDGVDKERPASAMGEEWSDDHAQASPAATEPDEPREGALDGESCKDHAHATLAGAEDDGMDQDAPRPASPLREQPREDDLKEQPRDDYAHASLAGAEDDGMDQDAPRPPEDPAHASPTGAAGDEMEGDAPRPASPPREQPRRDDLNEQPGDDYAHASLAGAEDDGMDQDAPRPASPLREQPREDDLKEQSREDTPDEQSREDHGHASPASAEDDGMDQDAPRPPEDPAHASPTGAAGDEMEGDAPRPASPPREQPRKDDLNEQPGDDYAHASLAGAEDDGMDQDNLVGAGLAGDEQGSLSSALPKRLSQNQSPSSSVKRRGEQPPSGSPPRRRQRTLGDGPESAVPELSDTLPFPMVMDSSLRDFSNVMPDLDGYRSISEFSDLDSMSVEGPLGDWSNGAGSGIGPDAGYSGFLGIGLQGPAPILFQTPSMVAGEAFNLNSASYTSPPAGIPRPALQPAPIPYTSYAVSGAPFLQMNLYVSYKGTVLREQNAPIHLDICLIPIVPTSHGGQAVALLWLDQVVLGLQQRSSLFQGLPTHNEWWKADLQSPPAPEAAGEEERPGVPAVQASEIALSLSLHLGSGTFTMELGSVPPASTAIVFHPVAHLVVPTPEPDLPLHATLVAERRPIGETWSIVLHILTTLPSANKAFRCNGLLEARLALPKASDHGRLAPASCNAAGSTWPYLQTICDLVQTTGEAKFWLLKDSRGQEVACISFGAVTWVSESWFAHVPLSQQGVGCIEGRPLYSVPLDTFPLQEPTRNHCSDQETATWTHEYLQKRQYVDTSGRKVSKPVDKEFKADKMQRYRALCNAEVQSRAPERLDLAELRAQEWDGLSVFSAPTGELDEKAFVEPRNAEQAKDVEELSHALRPVLHAFLSKDPIACWCKEMPKEGQRDHVAICLWELYDMVTVCSFLYKLSLSWKTIPEIDRAIKPLSLPPYLVRRLQAGQTTVPMPLVVAKYFNTKPEQVRGAYKLFKMVHRSDFPLQLKLFHCLRYPGEPSQNKWTPMFQLGWADSHLDMNGAVSSKALNSQGIDPDLVFRTESPGQDDQPGEPNPQRGARQHGEARGTSAASSVAQQQVQASAHDQSLRRPASKPAGGSEARRAPGPPKKADQASSAVRSAADDGVRRGSTAQPRASTRRSSKANSKQRAAVPDQGEDPKEVVAASSTQQSDQQDRFSYEGHPFAHGPYPAGAAAAGFFPPGPYQPYLMGPYPYGFPYVPAPSGPQRPTEGHGLVDRHGVSFPGGLYSQPQTGPFQYPLESYHPMHFPFPGGPQGVARVPRMGARAPGPYEPSRPPAKSWRSRPESEQGWELQDEEDEGGPSGSNDPSVLSPQSKVAARGRSGAPRLPPQSLRRAQELDPVQEAQSGEEYDEVAEQEPAEEVMRVGGASTTQRSGSPSVGRAMQGRRGDSSGEGIRNQRKGA